MSRRSGACLRCCLVVFAVVSALCVSGPALYWKFKKGLKHTGASSVCSPCVCDCPPPLSLIKIAPGTNIFSLSLIHVFLRVFVVKTQIEGYPYHIFRFLVLLS